MIQQCAVIRSAGCCQKQTRPQDQRRELFSSGPQNFVSGYSHYIIKTRLSAIILQRLSLPRAVIVNLFADKLDFPQINFTLIFGLYKLLRVGKTKERELWCEEQETLKKQTFSSSMLVFLFAGPFYLPACFTFCSFVFLVQRALFFSPPLSQNSYKILCIFFLSAWAASSVCV